MRLHLIAARMRKLLCCHLFRDYYPFADPPRKCIRCAIVASLPWDPSAVHKASADNNFDFFDMEDEHDTLG